MTTNISPMRTPETRAEFEVRLHLLRENICNGKMKFFHGLKGPDSLSKIRYLPNRRIDLLSIDEMARLDANMIYHLHQNKLAGILQNKSEDIG